MGRHLDEGLAAAEAASLAMQGAEADEDRQASSLSFDHQIASLRNALESFDDAGGHAVLDELLSAFSIETVITQALLPYLEDLGSRWAASEVSVAQEHFASNLIRGRLLNLARGWDQGYGRRALLACLEGDLHDIALICFGLALHRRGWRITFLGASTPIETVVSTALQLDPQLIVFSASRPEPLEGFETGLKEMARGWNVAVGGRGGSPQLAERTGIQLLDVDPVRAADLVAHGPC